MILDNMWSGPELFEQWSPRWGKRIWQVVFGVALLLFLGGALYAVVNGFDWAKKEMGWGSPPQRFHKDTFEMESTINNVSFDGVVLDCAKGGTGVDIQGGNNIKFNQITTSGCQTGAQIGSAASRAKGTPK